MGVLRRMSTAEEHFNPYGLLSHQASGPLQPLAKWVGWSKSLSELVTASLAHFVSGSPSIAARPGMPGHWGADRYSSF